MVSWWAKDDTRGPKEGRDERLKAKLKQTKEHKNKVKLTHGVTQPTQIGRIGGGVPSPWQGTGQHSKHKTEIAAQ